MTPPPSAFAHRRAVLAHIIDRNALRYVATLEDLIILSRHGESAVQSFIEGRFRQLGGQVETFQYDPRTIAVPYEFVAPSLVASDRLTAVVSTWPGDGGAGKSLLIFAHPDSELTVDGLLRLGCEGYGRAALIWSLRVLERRGFLRSSRVAPAQRRYRLPEDPAVRTGLQLCLRYYS